MYVSSCIAPKCIIPQRLAWRKVLLGNFLQEETHHIFPIPAGEVSQVAPDSVWEEFQELHCGGAPPGLNRRHRHTAEPTPPHKKFIRRENKSGGVWRLKTRYFVPACLLRLKSPMLRVFILPFLLLVACDVVRCELCLKYVSSSRANFLLVLPKDVA